MLILIKSTFEKFYATGWLVLLATMTMWGANIVAGRLAVGQISPMTLVAGRWLIVSAIMAMTQRQTIRRDLAALSGHWPLVIIGGLLGFTAFNALFYVAAHYTNGVNIAILQGSFPIFTMLGGFLFLHMRFSPLQIAGLAVTLAGVILVASKGELANLAAFHFNIGDIFMLIASVFYAAYALALRNRPRISAMGLFAVMSAVAFATSVPLFIWDITWGDFIWPTPLGIGVLFYVALFPSLVGQIFFMRGVELIGPGRAGLFGNLLPVMGALMSIVMLGESFALYHALALVLVLAGIFVAERGRS